MTRPRGARGEGLIWKCVRGQDSNDQGVKGIEFEVKSARMQRPRGKSTKTGGDSIWPPYTSDTVLLNYITSYGLHTGYVAHHI